VWLPLAILHPPTAQKPAGRQKFLPLKPLPFARPLLSASRAIRRFLEILNYYTKIKNGTQRFSRPVIKELLFVTSVSLF
jgi:hypothetical protein